MHEERRWDEVDSYLGSQLLEQDAVLDEVARASEEAGLPAIAVSPLQGKLLYMLARLIGAARCSR